MTKHKLYQFAGVFDKLPRLSETSPWNSVDDPNVKDPRLQKRPTVVSKTRARLERAAQIALAPATEVKEAPLINGQEHPAATMEVAASTAVGSNKGASSAPVTSNEVSKLICCQLSFKACTSLYKDLTVLDGRSSDPWRCKGEEEVKGERGRDVAWR